MQKHHVFDFWKRKKTWNKDEYLNYLYYHGWITVHDYKLAHLHGTNLNAILDKRK